LHDANVIADGIAINASFVGAKLQRWRVAFAATPVALRKKVAGVEGEAERALRAKRLDDANASLNRGFDKLAKARP
jgi:hypothetical protein